MIGRKTIVYDREGKELTRCDSTREACRYIGYSNPRLSGNHFDSFKRYGITKVGDFFIGIAEQDKDVYTSHQAFIHRVLKSEETLKLKRKKEDFIARRESVLRKRYRRIFILNNELDIIEVFDGHHSDLAKRDGMTEGSMKKFLSPERVREIILARSPFTFKSTKLIKRIYIPAEEYYYYKDVIKVFQEAKEIKEKFEESKSVLYAYPHSPHKRVHKKGKVYPKRFKELTDHIKL